MTSSREETGLSKENEMRDKEFNICIRNKSTSNYKRNEIGALIQKFEIKQKLIFTHITDQSPISS
jgi:hypothetical protein